MPTVIITHQIPKAGLDALYESCKVLYPDHAPCFTESELLAMAPEADAVLAGGQISGDFVREARRLRVVSNYGAGYDRVHVPALTEAKIPLTNLSEETAMSTAELAMALLLSLSRRIPELDRRLRGDSPEQAFGMGKHMGHNLFGRTLGIVGMGSIGGKVRGMAQAFGMRVVYHNRTQLPAERACGAEWLPLEELVAVSDAVTLHCPYTRETDRMIGEDEFARMKPGAVIINTSRGRVIDHEALIAALLRGAIAGAGLDVYPDEPNIPEALRSMPQVVLTPHIGTNTHEARKLMSERAAQNILDVLAGRRPERVVNPEVYA